MQADLSDLRYLYRYGAYIGDNERQIAAYLNTLPEADIQAMADTYTEATGSVLRRRARICPKRRRRRYGIRLVLSAWCVRQCAILKKWDSK